MEIRDGRIFCPSHACCWNFGMDFGSGRRGLRQANQTQEIPKLPPTSLLSHLHGLTGRGRVCVCVLYSVPLAGDGEE